MTNISIEKDKGPYLIESNGHATGSNEVCTCISYTMYSLLGYLENKPLALFEKEMDEAHFKIVFSNKEKNVFEYVMFSLIQLSANFPDFVKLTSNSIHFFDNLN